MTPSATDRNGLQAQALAIRLFGAGLSTAELFAAYLGVRLGLYAVLASSGPMTADQLAERATIDARYAREWLEQQAVAGVVEVDDVRRPSQHRLYILPPGHAEALTDSESVNFITPMVLLPVGAIAGVLPRLLLAYRSGAGIPYGAYDDDFHNGQGTLNRGVFSHQLPRWIERVLPDVHSNLRAGCRIADVACGTGWSSIALARAYPKATIDGFDCHEPSIHEARRNAATSGVGDRVRFEVKYGYPASDPRTYRLVCIFDALHDMAQPIEMLRGCRRILEDSGSLLLMEPKAAQAFTAPGDETERFLYAISLLHCLPVGLSEQPSVGTGTVMRPDTVRSYALEAGFTEVKILPVEHRFHRLYHLLA